MIRAIFVKEIWDLRAVIAVGLLVHSLLLANLLGIPLPGWLPLKKQDALPFPQEFPNLIMLYGGILAAALGLLQGCSDQGSQRWLFLLSQPITRAQLVLGKLVVGLLIWTLVCLGTLLSGALLVKIPGVFPAPFEWWMLQESLFWFPWIPVLYLAGFLSGIRQGSWFGTRLIPLLGCYAWPYLEIYYFSLEKHKLSLFQLPIIFVHGLFIVATYFTITITILEVTQNRDYP